MANTQAGPQQPQPLHDSHVRDWIEITINIPYGQLAAKWWGRRDVRPIVCLHGWQDNAGTFDPLIPMLPDHVGYLAIDLPGHGLSSFQPHGVVYGHVQFLHILNYVFREHFGWPRVSLIGHSMSSQMMFVYAATFPDYVDLAIGFDALTPKVPSEGRTRRVLESVNGNWLRTDLNNMNNVEPPTYAYDELLDKMVQATDGSLDRESAPYLLQRGSAVSRSDPERYYFRRDNRLKMLNHFMLTPDMMQKMARDIRCPYMFFKSSDSAYSEDRVYFQLTAETMQESNPLFELHGVDGGHHVLLVEPHKVAGKMAPFIRKHRPVDEPHVQSKL